MKLFSSSALFRRAVRPFGNTNRQLPRQTLTNSDVRAVGGNISH
jgi:hypothetical protein